MRTGLGQSVFIKSRFFAPAFLSVVLAAIVLACGGGGGDSKEILLSNNAPTITAVGNQTATPGTAYSLQIEAYDPDGDTLTYSLKIYPDGMSISSSGLISWTPTTAQGGTNEVVVQVDDGRGGRAASSFSINVSGVTNLAPVVTAIADQPATVGSTLSVQVVATDPDGSTLNYSLSTKPTGMTISSSGLITWIPNESQGGYHPVTVAVSDPEGGLVFVTFTVAVPMLGNHSPEIPTLDNKLAVEGGGLNSYGNILVSDSDGDTITYTLFLDSVDAPPAWIQVVAVSGGVNIYWSPTADPSTQGTYELTLKADDGLGGIDTETFTLTVQPVGTSITPNNAPVYSAGLPNNLEANALAVFRSYVKATDADNDSIVFSARDKASGEAIEGIAITTRVELSGTQLISYGIIEWRPTREQAKNSAYAIEIVASDGHGGATVFDLAVNVNIAGIKDQGIKIGSGAGEEYNYPLPHLGANYTWEISSAPVWLSMNPAGPVADSSRLTGTIPLATGTETVTFTVKNLSGTVVDTVSYNINLVNSVKSLDKTQYRSLSTGTPYLGDLFLHDWNGDGLKDVVVAGDGTGAATTRSIYRWTRQAGAFDAKETFSLYQNPNYYAEANFWWGGSVPNFNTANSGYVSHFAVGGFYHFQTADLIYVVNDGGCKIISLPMNDLDNTPDTETPYVTMQTGVAGTPSIVEIADVYNAPALSDGSDYDNGYEVVFIVRDQRRLVVANAKGTAVQSLDFANSSCDINGYAYCMEPGDYDGDGLTDIAVTTWRNYDDAAAGFYRSVSSVEIFLQEDVDGTYKLVSKGLFTLDIGNSPRTGVAYDLDYLRPIRSISAGDIDGDGKAELAVAYQRWAAWDLSYYSNFYAHYGYVKVYKYGSLSSDSVTPSTALKTVNEKARVWVSTQTAGPAYQVRVTDDDGATWTSYTSSTTTAFSAAINCISSTHRHPTAPTDTYVNDRRYYWFGTAGNGMVRFDGYNSWTQITSSNSGIGNNTIQVVEMPGGTDDGSGWGSYLFVGTQNGLYRWTNTATTLNANWATMTGLADTDVREITHSEFNWYSAIGRYKVISGPNGQTRYDENNTTPQSTNTNIVGAVNGYLCADNDNFRWYATDRGVATQQNIWSANWRYYTTSSGSAYSTTSLGDSMTGIVDGGPGTLNGTNWYSTRWVCTSSAGAARMFDNVGYSTNTTLSSRWEQFTTSNGLPSVECTRVDVDSRRNVWLGTRSGLVKFTPPTASPWISYTPTTLLNGEEILDVYVEGHAWNQIADVKIADVTADGKPDLVVASNGFVYCHSNTDEVRRRDRDRSISPKISILEQEYSGGNFGLRGYLPNIPYQEAYLNNIYTGRDTAYFFMPYRRHVISIGDVDGDGYEDIGLSVNYGAQHGWEAEQVRVLIYWAKVQ